MSLRYRRSRGAYYSESSFGTSLGSTLSWAIPRDAGTGISGYRVSLDDGLTQALTEPTLDLSTLAAGTHTVRVTAVDYAGNTSKTTTLRFTR